MVIEREYALVVACFLCVNGYIVGVWPSLLKKKTRYTKDFAYKEAKRLPKGKDSGVIGYYVNEKKFRLAKD